MDQELSDAAAYAPRQTLHVHSPDDSTFLREITSRHVIYDVMSYIGLRESMRIYLQNNLAKFHSDPTGNIEALGLKKKKKKRKRTRRKKNKHNKNKNSNKKRKKTSIDMRSVQKQINSALIRRTNTIFRRLLDRSRVLPLMVTTVGELDATPNSFLPWHW